MAAETSKSRAKDAQNVDPNEVLQYLLSKNISINHAIGMVTNMYYESLFDPLAMGDKGTSAGLFQHHADRKDKLMKATNGDLSNWKAQVDYALSENASKKYLSRSFKTPEEASYWFTYNWENPSNRAEKAVQRQSWIKSFNGGQYFTGIYNPNNLDVELKAVAPSKSSGKKATYTNLEGTAAGISEPQPYIPSAYIPPEMMSGVDYGPQEFVAEVEKEQDKQVEKETKSQESTARAELDAKTQEAQQKENELAFLKTIQKAVDVSALNQNQNTSQEDQNRMANMAAGYQFEEMPIQQSLPQLPTIYQFEEGGEKSEEDEEEVEESENEDENNKESEDEDSNEENMEEDEESEDNEDDEEEDEGEDKDEEEDEDEVEYLTPEEIEELIKKGYKIEYVKE